MTFFIWDDNRIYNVNAVDEVSWKQFEDGCVVTIQFRHYEYSVQRKFDTYDEMKEFLRHNFKLV